MSDKKGVKPILQIWTRRYALLLLAMLLILYAAAGCWYYYNTQKTAYTLLQTKATQMANMYGQMISYDPSEFHIQMIEPAMTTVNSNSEQMQVINMEASIIYSSAAEVIPIKAADTVLKGNIMEENVSDGRTNWIQVGVPIQTEGAVVGGIYLSQPLSTVTSELPRLYLFGAGIMLLTGFIGWYAIYMLLKKLTHPLRELSEASIQIASGDYSPTLELPDSMKEQEVRELVLSFREMTSQLRKMEAMRTDLLAGISHELKTPITSIKGIIQSVRDGVVTGDDMQDFLQMAMDESARMERMVTDLLSFSSLETGNLETQPEKICCSNMIENIFQQIDVLPDITGPRLFNTTTDPSVAIIADPEQIRQIVLNLLSNSIAAGADTITIGAEEDGDFVNIIIKDNGKGISEEDIPYIFERYYRGSRSKKRKQGLGLGLPLCRRLARGAGGDVELITTSAAGTEFKIKFPK